MLLLLQILLMETFKIYYRKTENLKHSRQVVLDQLGLKCNPGVQHESVSIRLISVHLKGKSGNC